MKSGIARYQQCDLPIASGFEVLNDLWDVVAYFNGLFTHEIEDGQMTCPANDAIAHRYQLKYFWQDVIGMTGADATNIYLGALCGFIFHYNSFNVDLCG